MALAAAKAEEVAAQAADDDVVVAADTIVWLDGRPFGKPHSREEAMAMLRRLSGNTHHVYTGVAVLRGGMERLGCECTAVHFREIPEEEIARYVDSGEPMDKAGAYGVEDHQIAGEHALHPETGLLLFFRITGEFLPFEGAERGGGGVVTDRAALSGHNAGYAGGQISFPQTGSALQEQVGGHGGEVFRKLAAAAQRDLRQLPRHAAGRTGSRASE